MRKIYMMPLLFLLFFVGFSQQVIENPEKPLTKNAGRVIQLKEVMRITDTEGKYFFKGPIEVKVAEDGFIYVQESDQLYQFDARGKFLRNLYKKGQGPGELNQSLDDVLLAEAEIILFSSQKIVRLDRQGKLIEDFRPQGKLFRNLLGSCGGRFYLLSYDRGVYARDKSGLYEDNLKLEIVKNAREVTPTSYVFPFTISFQIGEQGRRGTAWISRVLTASPEPRYVYLSHTPEYQVKLLDFEKNEIIGIFRRKYERVKLVRKTRNSLVMPEFSNDICRLLVHKDNLWAVTSTFDRKKGILVDVFNKDGKYLDAFYLPLTRILTEGRTTYYAPMAVSGDFLFTIEVGDEGLISVAKYEMIDK